MWSALDGQFQWDLVGHTGGISDVSWSHDSAQLASASDDRTVMIWDVESQKAVATLTGHANYVYCVSYNPMGNILASGSFDESVKLWDLRSKTCITTLPAHSDPVSSIDWNKDGTLLASSSYDGLLRIWDSQSFSCLKTINQDNNQAVSFVRFAPNGKFLLASTLDSTMRLWSHSDGKNLKTYTGHTNTKLCLFACFGVDNVLGRNYVLSGSEDNNAYIWDLQSKVQMVMRAFCPVAYFFFPGGATGAARARSARDWHRLPSQEEHYRHWQRRRGSRGAAVDEQRSCSKRLKIVVRCLIIFPLSIYSTAMLADEGVGKT